MLKIHTICSDTPTGCIGDHILNYVNKSIKINDDD